MNMKHAAILLFALACSAGCVHSRTSFSPWMPYPQSTSSELDATETQAILESCGLDKAERISICNLDLDADGKEDSFVIVDLPPELGPNWTNYRQLTYVFQGRNPGPFSGDY